MKYPIITSAIICALFATSCQSTSTKNVFAGLDPSSTQYKKELTRQFLSNGTQNFTFNFDGLKTVEGKDYMEVLITGNGLQAQSLVQINNWNKLEDIKRTKGAGYRGAELKNLQLDVDNSAGNPTFIYRDLDKIID